MFQISRNPQTRNADRPRQKMSATCVRNCQPGPYRGLTTLSCRSQINRQLADRDNPTGTFPRLRQWSESRRLQVNLAVLTSADNDR